MLQFLQNRVLQSVAALIACAAAVSADPPRRAHEIRIPVWADSRPGDAITPKDFRVTLDGAPSRVLEIRGPKTDLMILLVLDLTGDLSYVEPAKTALISDIQKLPPHTTVGLLRAQDGLSVLLDPTTDRAALANAIRTLPISGNPGVLDTVDLTERIADSILTRSGVRVAVFYVTDSNIYDYREDFTNPVINSSDSNDLSRRFPEALVQGKISKLKAKLSSDQAPLFLVHLTYRTERLNEAYQSGLKELVETMGGASTFCKSSGEIPSAISKTFEQILSYYSVTLVVPAHAKRNIQIQIEANGAKILSYRTRFVLK